MEKIEQTLIRLANSFKSETNELRIGIILHDYINVIKNNSLLSTYVSYLEKQTTIKHEPIDLQNLKIIDFKNKKITDNTWFFYGFLKSFYTSFEISKKLFYKKESPVSAKELGDPKQLENDLNNLTDNKLFDEFPNDLLESIFVQFHELIMAKLIGEEFFNRETDDGKIHFNEEKSELKVRGHKILLSLKNAKTNAHYIIKYILKNGLEENHFFSEIADSDELADDKKTLSWWRKYHHACEDIKEKVRIGTDNEIKDFLIIKTGKTGSVRINPDYI